MVDAKPPAQTRHTIYDVAREAGVSHQTVSRYLKGFEGIRPETRERVERALRELNYRPNLAARSLATSRSHRIGALAYEMFETGPSKIMLAASGGARDAGYLLDIVSLDPADDGEVDTAIRLLDQQDLAGILALAPTQHVREAILEVPFAVPVFVESGAPDDVSAWAHSVDGYGIVLVVEHLIALGHRRIAYLGGPGSWYATLNGSRAYRETMRAHGLEPLDVLEGDWSAESGARAADSLAPEVTAIATANDQMALGVLHRLAETGRRVPEDVSVAGFDDIPESAYFIPSLTTVRLDYEGQGRSAIATLIAMIEGRERAEPAELPQARLPLLVPRRSTGPVRAA